MALFNGRGTQTRGGVRWFRIGFFTGCGTQTRGGVWRMERRVAKCVAKPMHPLRSFDSAPEAGAALRMIDPVVEQR
jgi:hypothetical protein